MVGAWLRSLTTVHCVHWPDQVKGWNESVLLERLITMGQLPTISQLRVWYWYDMYKLVSCDINRYNMNESVQYDTTQYDMIQIGRIQHKSVL